MDAARYTAIQPRAGRTQMKLNDVADVSVDALWAPFTALWAKLVAFTPRLLAVLVIMVVGYTVSALLRRLAAAVLRRVGFDDASRRIGVRALLDRAGIAATASEVIGSLVFWLFLLTFLISAAETLGLHNVSLTIDALVRYLPNVIGAAVIAVVGLMVAHFLRDAVRAGTASLGVEYSGGVSGIIYVMLIVIVVSLAVGQLRIQTELFNRVVEIVLVTSGGALGLALGLGTRDIARHLVTGAYARELFRPGTELSIGEDTGTVDEVGPLFTRLAGHDGRHLYVPNGRLTESVLHEGRHAHARAAQEPERGPGAA
jgi:Mechanosensitive ion channel, conserved TM helix